MRPVRPATCLHIMTCSALTIAILVVQLVERKPGCTVGLLDVVEYWSRKYSWRPASGRMISEAIQQLAHLGLLMLSLDCRDAPQAIATSDFVPIRSQIISRAEYLAQHGYTSRASAQHRTPSTEAIR